MEQVIIQGDCLEEMKKLESDSIDLILTDPPYGTIKGLGNSRVAKEKKYNVSKWDVTLDNKKMFRECERVLRRNGKLILFSQEPYTSKLITEAKENLPFLYRLIWLKDHFANCLVANKSPVNYFEDILVFQKHNPKNEVDSINEIRDYFLNERKKTNLSYKEINEKCFNSASNGGGMASNILTSYKLGWTFPTKEKYESLKKIGICKEDYKRLKERADFLRKRYLEEENIKFPSVFNLPEKQKTKSNVFKYKKDYEGLHPTQKPVELLKDLILTFSNEGDVVLDFTAGSFSTLVACQQTNRKGIGIELEEKYVKIGRDRLKQKVLSNLSPPVQTSNSTSLTSAKQKEFNKGDKVSATPTPKDASHPSHHPNIKLNNPTITQMKQTNQHTNKQETNA